MGNNNMVAKDILSCFRSDNVGEVEQYSIGYDNIFTYPRTICSIRKRYVDQVFTCRFTDTDMIDLSKLDIMRVQKVVRNNNAASSSFYGIKGEREFLQNINKIPILKKYYCHYLDKENFQKCLGNRNVKRARNECKMKQAESEYEIYYILQMGNLKTQYRDSEEMVHQQAKLLLCLEKEKKAVVFYTEESEKITGGIVAIILQNQLYMLVNNYIPQYLIHRPNDFLYDQLIHFAMKQDIDLINWGETEGTDEGLIRFKKKYSSIIEEKKSLHLLWQV